MQSDSVTIATWKGISLSLQSLLRRMHLNGQLKPLMREALVDQFLLDQAAAAGLRVSNEELQQEADNFRRSYGMQSAAQTFDWLKAQKRSMLDFESGLERGVLIEKFKDHLVRDLIPVEFAREKAQYDRATLRVILVARKDLARELLLQARDEGIDFADLARQHSKHPSRDSGGLLGVIFRRQLSAEVADAAFEATAGSIVGPLAASEGFCLFLVESRQVAVLDHVTASMIRQVCFDAWLEEQLRMSPMDFPLLGVL